MERLVETALGQAGDFAAASRWRRAIADLSSGLRVGIIGTDPHAVSTLTEQLSEQVHVHPIVLAADDDRDEAGVLGVHALLWAAPATVPLGASEREAMQSLGDLVPQRCAVVLTGHDLLRQMSDDPQTETQAVEQRLTEHLPAGWTLLRDLAPWLKDLHAHWAEIDAARRRDVACVLLRDARAHTVLTLAQLSQEERTLRQEVDHLTEQLAEAQTRATQTAAHVISSLDRHTQALMSEHSAFVYALEAALPEELASASDHADLANGVADWLVHVLGTWTHDALERWTDAVHADLDGIADDAWLAVAHLVLPPPSTPSLAGSTTWTHRLLVSGAIAGGAGLVIAGQWLPGLGLATGGAAIALLRQYSAGLSSDTLVEVARQALREMGHEGQAILRSRREQLAAATRTVAQQQLAPLQDALDTTTQALERAAQDAVSRREEVERARIVLDARLHAMHDAS